MYNGGQAFHERKFFSLPLFCLGFRLGLYLAYPWCQQMVEFHSAKYHASYHTHENTACNIYTGNFPPECTCEHSHCNLIDQWGGYEESKCDPQWYAPFYKPYKQRD